MLFLTLNCISEIFDLPFLFNDGYFNLWWPFQSDDTPSTETLGLRTREAKNCRPSKTKMLYFCFYLRICEHIVSN